MQNMTFQSLKDIIVIIKIGSETKQKLFKY